MKEKIVKPLELSDDWDNNLYRNVVHILAENENMIPGGQAELVIQIMKALLKQEIEKVENPYKELMEIKRDPSDTSPPDPQTLAYEQCRRAILEILT